jgi:hypothetical protein
MSILNFPRIHFQGFARIHAPTGHKNGLVDVGGNRVYQDGELVEHNSNPAEYHQYLENLGPRFNAQGQWDENGEFSRAKGWDFGGNGHFAINAKIVSTQRNREEVDTKDAVVGSSVDFWGHHNEYLGTTFNRARIFECDPASNWTSTIMVGQLAFGRKGNSNEVPYMVSAPVEGMQPARWQDFNHLRELAEHCLNGEFSKSAVHQFVVDKSAEDLLWTEAANNSATVSLLREAMKREDVLGLVVQFGLSNMSAPLKPDSPVFWELHGTIGLWCKDEMRTYPDGRLLIPTAKRLLSNLTVRVNSDGASLNMVTSVPCVGRAVEAGEKPIHAIERKLDLGELELRTVVSNTLIAKIPSRAYQKEAHQLTSGIVDVPLAASWEEIVSQVKEEGLLIVDSSGKILLQEQEINLQVDDACLFLEFPHWQQNDDRATEIEIHSFFRGHPAAIDNIYLNQFYNPKAFPQLKYEFERHHPDETFHYPPSEEMEIIQFKPGKRSETGEFAAKCLLNTDETGRGWLTIRGSKSGTTRVLLSVNPETSAITYDNDDVLGFWSGAGSFAVRVLSNDWQLLADTPDEAVDFPFIYEHILAYYELAFSFMKAEVFSLADKCKVETYARLMWQMSDPQNKYKTYYMPPTRDMSEPKALLLRKFLENQQRVGYVPEAPPVPKQTQRTIQTREQLVTALRHAAELEIAVMLQYIYAAYSIPNYATGQQYVEKGLWTEEQLHLACGDNKEVRDYGMRGLLLEISREEMIHFLMVNNILMAIGEPFYAPVPNFAEINRRFPIEVDFSLEPFNSSSLQRFMQFEFPDFLAADLTNEPEVNDPHIDRLHGYGSLSELYRQIRQGLENIPDLFLVKKGEVGGEHHLFLRQDFNKSHPDYQFEVDDLNSALFAIDLIVEQGEGCESESPKFEQSHYQRFRHTAEALAQQQINHSQTGHKVPWNPAYPALRNPTLQHRDYHSHIVTVPQTRAVMEIFNECYFLMMQLMVQHFGLNPTGSLRRSKLMNAAIDVMTGMMRPLGELLMTLPSGKRGKTAGPSFEIQSPVYISNPTVAYSEIARRFEQLGQKARQQEVIHSTVYEMFDFYANFFDEMAENIEH